MFCVPWLIATKKFWKSFIANLHDTFDLLKSQVNIYALTLNTWSIVKSTIWYHGINSYERSKPSFVAVECTNVYKISK